MSHSGTDDYYATLGVEPRSEAAVIRAAYHALMHLYHPDKNASPAAVERAHAIIAAFAVLGDREKRLHYDWARRRAAEAAAQLPRWSLGRLPRPLIAALLALVVLAPFVVMQAPRTRFDQTVGPAVPEGEVDQAPITTPKETAIVPLVALTTVPALKPDAIVAPVLIEPRAAQPQPRITEPTLPFAVAPRASLAPRERPQARPADKSPEPRARASTKCRFVRPGAESAICENDNLTALDRNVVAFYNQSLQYGAATKRGVLLDARNAFLARREACRSDACLQGLHLDHLRELSAIVENRPLDPPR